MTNRHGVDVVLDPVGGRSFETSYRLLAPLGRLVMFGASAIATGERRNWLHAARLMWQMPRFHPLSLIESKSRRLRLESRPPVGSGRAVARGDGRCARRRRGGSPEADRCEDISARADGGRPPLSAEPFEHRQGRADDRRLNMGSAALAVRWTVFVFAMGAASAASAGQAATADTASPERPAPRCRPAHRRSSRSFP